MSDNHRTLRNSIRIARSLHTNRELDGSYAKSPCYISVAKYASVVQDTLRNRHNNPDFLLVTTHEEVHTERFYGSCPIYVEKGKAAVTFTLQRSRCWQRFIWFKELSHHYMGMYHEDGRGGDYMLRMAQVSRGLCEDPDCDLGVEGFALSLAIEISLAWHYREQIFGLMRDISSNRAAESARVPLVLLQRIADGPYRDLSGHLNFEL